MNDDLTFPVRVYTEAGTSPDSGDDAPRPVPVKPRAQAASSASGSGSAKKICPECGSAIVKPRRNQVFCSAACNRAARARKAQRNAPRHHGRAECPECGTVFERARPDQQFCSAACRQAEANFWKRWSGRIAEAMHAWRVERRKGGMSLVSHVYAQARAEQRAIRAAKKQTRAQAASSASDSATNKEAA